MQEYLKVCDKCITRKALIDKKRKRAEQLLREAKTMRLSTSGEVMVGSKVVALVGGPSYGSEKEMDRSAGEHQRTYVRK